MNAGSNFPSCERGFGGGCEEPEGGNGRVHRCARFTYTYIYGYTPNQLVRFRFFGFGQAIANSENVGLSKGMQTLCAGGHDGVVCTQHTW